MTTLRAILLCALVLPASAAFAQPVQKGGRATTAPAPILLRLPGTIEKYDSATRTLTLSTERGPARFSLGAAFRILHDGQLIDAAALEHLIGCRAAVRYAVTGANKTVESVHVFRKPPEKK